MHPRTGVASVWPRSARTGPPRGPRPSARRSRRPPGAEHPSASRTSSTPPRRARAGAPAARTLAGRTRRGSASRRARDGGPRTGSRRGRPRRSRTARRARIRPRRARAACHRRAPRAWRSAAAGPRGRCRGCRRDHARELPEPRQEAREAGWLHRFRERRAREPDRLALSDLGGLFAALEALATALDGGDELREVDLERVEDLVGVVLGPEADLALAGAGVLDDVLGGALGLLGDLLVADQPLGALARLLDDALGLALGLGEHLLALLDDP